MEFVNKEVAEKYQPEMKADRAVTIQGMYSGPLSKIPMDVADKLVAQKSNLLIPKTAKAVVAPPAKTEEKK